MHQSLIFWFFDYQLGVECQLIANGKRCHNIANPLCACEGLLLWSKCFSYKTNGLLKSDPPQSLRELREIQKQKKLVLLCVLCDSVVPS